MCSGGRSITFFWHFDHCGKMFSYWVFLASNQMQIVKQRYVVLIFSVQLCVLFCKRGTIPEVPPVPVACVAITTAFSFPCAARLGGAVWCHLSGTKSRSVLTGERQTHWFADGKYFLGQDYLFSGASSVLVWPTEIEGQTQTGPFCSGKPSGAPSRNECKELL